MLMLMRSLLNKLIAAALFYHMRRKCQRQLKQAQQNLPNMVRLDVKSVQGSLTKEIGFYAERSSTHNTPKPKVKAKALTGYFRPIIISHKSQTSQDQCLWQHDWWVCRRECQEKWSPAPYLPYFSLWVRLGVFMEKSHGRCDEHYPVIMKGTLLYCQPPQTDMQAGTRWQLRDVVHSCVYVPLCLYLETRINEHIYIFTLCQRRDCFICCCLHSWREMSRGNQVKCGFFQCYSWISNCILKIFGWWVCRVLISDIFILTGDVSILFDYSYDPPLNHM